MFFLLALLVSLVILCALLVWLAHFVISPLSRLKADVGEIDVENLSDIRLPFSGGEEFVAVTRTINKLLDKAAGYVDELELKVEERTQELSAANQELTAQNEEMTAMNEEIASLNQNPRGYE